MPTTRHTRVRTHPSKMFKSIIRQSVEQDSWLDPEGDPVVKWAGPVQAVPNGEQVSGVSAH